MDLQKAAQEERLPIYSAEQVKRTTNLTLDNKLQRRQVGESLLVNHRDMAGKSKEAQYAKGWTSKVHVLVKAF